ncbi:hypothetical protein C8N43_1407 [Litoreibacter ponti]|uniref:Uncharacterized protein n=1 Tax=Litoreibacter ponti TaxID=1510457 RepID=A0A2T6BL21_9RHOB|nr:hypothetical protein C8N43_1407 [Litoreibacter ponti]
MADHKRPCLPPCCAVEYSYITNGFAALFLDTSAHFTCASVPDVLFTETDGGVIW